MKKLNRYEMAAVKRTAQNTKTLVRTREKLDEKMRELAGKIIEINSQVDVWERPLIEKWGHTSAEIIEMNGEIPEVTVVAESSSDVEL